MLPFLELVVIEFVRKFSSRFCRRKAKFHRLAVASKESIKATPRSDRLTALRAACLHIFRHLAQILLEIRRYSCVKFIQADEKSDGAIHTQSLCGVALTAVYSNIIVSPPLSSV